MGPLGLETVVIPDMHETLLSVYQICNGGSEDFQCYAASMLVQRRTLGNMAEA